MPLTLSFSNTADTSIIELVGELDATTAGDFHETIEKAASRGLATVEIRMTGLTYMASAGLRSLVFARQNMDEAITLVMAGAPPMVARTIRMAGLDLGIEMTDDYPG